MNESDKFNVVKKFGGWERMVIFSGVILTVPMFALLGTAVYSLVTTDRPDAFMGVLLAVVSLLVLWAIVWGMLWIVSGFRDSNYNGQFNGKSASNLEALQRENERLRQELEELKRGKQQ